MAFKDLFFVSDENPTEKPNETVKASVQPTKFPTASAPTTEASTASFTFPKSESVTTPTFTPQPTSAFGASNEHLEKAYDNYQKGFESLNQPGFDFYEFYQSIATNGFENPQLYTMAFQMAKIMDKTITKDKLIQQADFYVSEINKVCSENDSKGKNKKIEIDSYKSNENQSLLNELTLLKEQAETIKHQIEDRTRKLEAIGSKYDPQLSEIDSKLAANTTAKDRIVSSIEQVKQGIKLNII